MAGAAETVTVACKFPNGILMTVYKMDEYDEPVLGGGTRRAKRAAPVGEPIKINGPAAFQGEAPRCEVIGGYGLTHNVPKDIAEKWMVDNKDSPLVKNKVIFISGTADGVKGRAKDFKDERSGFERLDTSTKSQQGKQVPKDPRWPRSVSENLTNVATDARTDSGY